MNKQENNPLKQTKDILKFTTTQDTFSITADFRIYCNGLKNPIWDFFQLSVENSLLLHQACDSNLPYLALVMPFQQLF